jgi:uncharacterized repeat protein (TIGR04076 family)
MRKYRVRITVKEIKGECHIHKVGDSYLVEEDRQTLRFEKGEKFCTLALSGMLPLFSALSKELEEDDWMAAETQIYQCSEPGPERGGGGTVYFEIKREVI